MEIHAPVIVTIDDAQIRPGTSGMQRLGDSPADADRIWLTLREAASLCGCSPTYLCRLLSAGLLAGEDRGGRVMLRRDALRALPGQADRSASAWTRSAHEEHGLP